MLAFALAGDRTGVGAALAPDHRKAAARDPAMAFHTAQPLALVGATTEALDWLETAVERGFLNYEMLERDPLLARVRSDERFAPLVARARAARARFET